MGLRTVIRLEGRFPGSDQFLGTDHPPPDGAPVCPGHNNRMTLLACLWVLPVVTRSQDQTECRLTEPLHAEYLPRVRQGRHHVARVQVEQQQLAFERVAAVVAPRTNSQQGKNGVEGESPNRIPRPHQMPTPQHVLLIDADPVSRPLGVRGPTPTPLDVSEVSTHSDRPRALVNDGQRRFSDLGERAVAEHASDYRLEGHTGDLPGLHMSCRRPGRGTAAAHDPVGRGGAPIDFPPGRRWPYSPCPSR